MLLLCDVFLVQLFLTLILFFDGIFSLNKLLLELLDLFHVCLISKSHLVVVELDLLLKLSDAPLLLLDFFLQFCHLFATDLVLLLVLCVQLHLLHLVGQQFDLLIFLIADFLLTVDLFVTFLKPLAALLLSIVSFLGQGLNLVLQLVIFRL